MITAEAALEIISYIGFLFSGKEASFARSEVYQDIHELRAGRADAARGQKGMYEMTSRKI